MRDLIDLAQRLEGLDAQRRHARRRRRDRAGAAHGFHGRCTAKRAARASSPSSTRTTSKQVGLVKFDFLGLRTLTIIDWAVQAHQREAPRRRRGAARPRARCRWTTPRPSSCCAPAARRRSSSSNRAAFTDLVRKLQPDRFDDIVALVALFRPGPLQSGMVDDFIARKHGRAAATIDYLHPSLAEILKPTYGVILYQEQVMQIAQTLSGYTLGGADLLRRAMGKKKPEEMATQRSVFVDGAIARGVPAARAGYIFDLIEKFAGYGFNKSHSVAYALLAYQTAWLKAHYPEAFMAAVLSCDMEHTDKVVSFIDECAGLGIEVLPPDVNQSSYAFTVAGPGTIRYGLGAIKGVGEGAVDAIVGERDAGRRVPGSRRSLPARGPEARRQAHARGDGEGRQFRRVQPYARVARGGAAGGDPARRAAHACDGGGTGRPVRRAGRARATTVRRRRSCFPRCRSGASRSGSRANARRSACSCPAIRSPSSSRNSGRSRRRGSSTSAGRGPPASPASAAARPVTVAGLVLEMRRRGSRMTLVLDDRSARIEVSLFDDIWQQHRAVIVKRCDPGGRGPAALRRVHRRLAHQCEKAHADPRAARARGAPAQHPPAGRARRRPAARTAGGGPAHRARRPLRGGRCITSATRRAGR